MNNVDRIFFRPHDYFPNAAKDDYTMCDLPSLLQNACTTGDLSQAKALYHGAILTDRALRIPYLSQMAYFSAKHGHPSILSFCFDEGFTLNLTHINEPILMPLIRLMLEHGMDVNQELELAGSPLVMACSAGNVELASFFLENGGDPNNGRFVYEGPEALGCAISGSETSSEMVDLLLAWGTVIKGTGALTMSAEWGNTGAVKRLVEWGENNEDLDLEETEEYGNYDIIGLDQRGTALYKAAGNGHEEIVSFLLEKGANPRFRDREGRSVADVAEGKGHRSIAARVKERESLA